MQEKPGFVAQCARPLKKQSSKRTYSLDLVLSVARRVPPNSLHAMLDAILFNLTTKAG